VSYRIVIRPGALRQLAALPAKHRRQVALHIDRLAENPRPPGAKKLSGMADLYRLRSGVYRVVYQIQELSVTITVVRIAHRKDVYRSV